MTTDSLVKKLQKTSSISRFIKSCGNDIIRRPLNEYLHGLCKEKDITPSLAISNAGIERTYGYQIFNGTRKPSRDKLIQLALGMELSFDETQKLLKTARKSTLYARVERDIVIIYALNNKLACDDVQATLEDMKLPLLGESKDE